MKSIHPKSPAANKTETHSMGLKYRTTHYEDGEILVIRDTYFHDFTFGERVQVINSDLFNYHVKSTTGKFKTWWVSEEQVCKDGEWTRFKTENDIESGYKFDANGEVRIKIFSKMPRSYYYSAVNDAGDYYDRIILPQITRKHVSQLVKENA